MLTNIRSPEERRLVILRGIGQDLTSLEIATGMSLKVGMVIRDLRAMKYHRDPELKQAYIDQEVRASASKQALANVGKERFKLMTGMTFQEKNFENMVKFYQPELIKILGSEDETAAIMDLPRSVQRTLARNEITDGLRNRRRISSKARDFLPLKN